jgi:phosphogluconate dehydratase
MTSKPLNDTIHRVTQRIVERSRDSRRRYLDLMEREGERHADRNIALPCSNLAHGFAASEEDKESIATRAGPNIGIVTAYNDTISAHQPFGAYPAQMKIWAREVGATCQVAGATPAMCDGVTQGTEGMELSLSPLR